MAEKAELDPHQINYLQELKEHLDHLDKNKTYSLQRIDILVLAISTSAIILITSLIIELLKRPEPPSMLWFKISITLFAATILSNFLSQQAAYECNSEHYRITKDKIYDLTYFGAINEKKYDASEKKARQLTRRVGLYNACTIAILIIAVVLAIVTFWVVV